MEGELDCIDMDSNLAEMGESWGKLEEELEKQMGLHIDG